MLFNYFVKKYLTYKNYYVIYNIVPNDELGWMKNL